MCTKMVETLSILFTFCCNDDNATAYSCSIDICYKK